MLPLLLQLSASADHLKWLSMNAGLDIDGLLLDFDRILEFDNMLSLKDAGAEGLARAYDKEDMQVIHVTSHSYKGAEVTITCQAVLVVTHPGIHQALTPCCPAAERGCQCPQPAGVCLHSGVGGDCTRRAAGCLHGPGQRGCSGGCTGGAAAQGHDPADPGCQQPVCGAGEPVPAVQWRGFLGGPAHVLWVRPCCVLR